MVLLTVRSVFQDSIISGGPTQDFDVSGVTDTAKVGIYEVSSAQNMDDIRAHLRFGMGMTDGTTQRCHAGLCENDIPPTSADCDGRADNATVFVLTLATSSALNGEASWVQWNAGGSRVTWADFFSVALHCRATYFFGDGFQGSVHQVTTSASVGGTASISGLPFDADFVVVMTCDAAYTADQTFANMRHGVGYACRDSFTGGILQAGVFIHALDRSLVTPCASSLYDTGILRLAAAGVTPDVTAGPRLEVTALGTTVTFTTRDVAQSTELIVLAASMPKHRKWVGIPSLTTTSTGVKNITEPKFKPKCYWTLGTVYGSKNTEDGGGNSLHYCQGFASGSESGAFVLQAEDNVTGVGSNSDTRSGTSSNVLMLVDDAGATDLAAAHSAMGALGPSVNVVTASPSDRLAVFAVISEDPVGHSYLQALPPPKHRLRRM